MTPRFPAEMHIGDFLELCGIDAEFLIEGKTQVRCIRCVHLSSNKSSLHKHMNQRLLQPALPVRKEV